MDTLVILKNTNINNAFKLKSNAGKKGYSDIIVTPSKIISKLKQPELIKFESWQNMYSEEINQVMQYIEKVLASTYIESYNVSYTIDRMRNEIVKYMYETSDNRFKSYHFLK